MWIAKPFAAGALVCLVACGGGGGGSPTTYTVGGMVTGLAGSGLVLRDNGGDDLSITGNGSFVFSTPLRAGTAYSVTVDQQPTDPTLNCIVMNSGRNGVVQNANVTAVSVVCTAIAQLAFAGYSNSQSSGTLALRIDPQSGALGYLPGSQTTAQPPFTLAPGGHYAYGLGGGGIAGYAIDDISGTLATLAGSPYGVGAVPPADICVSSLPGTCLEAVPTVSSLAMDPVGQRLYAYYAQWYAPANPALQAVSTIVAFSINPSTGVLTALPVPQVEGLQWGMEIDPQGRFLYSGEGPDVHTLVGGPTGGVVHYLIDAMTGALTDSARDANPAWPLSFEPAGKFGYGPPNPQGDAAQSYAIDAVNGALTHVGSDVAALGLNSLVVDPAGAFAYGTCYGGICGFSLDPSNGQLTALPGSPFASDATLLPNSLVFDPSGKFLFCICATAICVYAPDPVTGVPKLTTSSPFAVNGVALASILVTN